MNLPFHVVMNTQERRISHKTDVGATQANTLSYFQGILFVSTYFLFQLPDIFTCFGIL